PTGSKKTRIRRGAPTRHSMVARCIRGKSWDNAGAWGAGPVSSRRDQAQEQTRSQQTTWGKSHTANMARPHPGSYAGAWQATGTPMADTELRIALLIDADNAPASRIEPILTELARHGVANVRRAYGNWKSPHLKSWEDCLHTYAIQPVQQFAYTARKNASDMAMVIDAMDLLYTGNLDGFAI